MGLRAERGAMFGTRPSGTAWSTARSLVGMWGMRGERMWGHVTIMWVDEDEHLDVAVGEEVLDQRAVGARHAGVVDGEAIRQQVGDVLVLARLRLGLQDLAARAVLLQELAQGVALQSHVAE